MVYLNDVGFVIKRINLGEADRFVTLFTRHNGKIEVLAKGVRKITSRRSSHIELLNLIKFHSLKTAKNFILTEVELINSFEKRKSNLVQCEVAFLVCELIDNLCPYNQVNTELFMHVLEFLKTGSEDDNSLKEFEEKILHHLGYWDMNRKFKTEQEVRYFIEGIIERKIKSRVIGKLG